MKKIFILLICIGILGLGGLVTYALYVTKPKAAVEPNEKVKPLIEIVELQAGSLEMKLPSQGVVEAKHNTTVAAEVGGKIDWISDRFEAGGEFEADEVILEIDDADYQASLAQAQATLEEARLNLASEEARAKQAKRDWDALGRDEEASALTLREPQLAAATAQVSAAESALERAERDLERTRVKAPYAARVERIHADIGAFVAAGTPLLDIHSLGPYEVRLPLSLDEYAFVEQTPEGDPSSSAALQVIAAGKEFSWDAAVIRSEGRIDSASRSIYLVAEVAVPEDSSSSLLQPGLFVSAQVDGITLKNVFRVPLTAFRDLEHVVVVSPDNQLFFREVDVIWRDEGAAIVQGGLKSGERLMITEIPDVVEGMSVRIDGEDENDPMDDAAGGSPPLAAERDRDADDEVGQDDADDKVKP